MTHDYHRNRHYTTTTITTTAPNSTTTKSTKTSYDNQCQYTC